LLYAIDCGQTEEVVTKLWFLLFALLVVNIRFVGRLRRSWLRWSHPVGCDEALRWFEAAAQNRLQRASAQRAIGRTLVALGDYREACVAFERAIRLTPFVRPEDLRELADCLRKTHRERPADELEQLADEKA